MQECTQKDKVSALHKELYGNGDSSKSICSRLTRVETNMKILLSLSTAQFIGLVGLAYKILGA